METLLSAEHGEVKPDYYYIIDNGGKLNLTNLPASFDKRVYKLTPEFNLGVAASWNHFLNIDGIKLICNDDVQFYADTIKLLVDGVDENFIIYPAGVPSANSFSCFIIPDRIIKEVGNFDATISPNYAYYEDNDYHRRMKMLGYDLKGIENCRLGHFQSATLKGYSKQELEEHHRKFRIATQNYKKKWGGLPGKEIYTYPYNIQP